MVDNIELTERQTAHMQASLGVEYVRLGDEIQTSARRIYTQDENIAASALVEHESLRTRRFELARVIGLMENTFNVDLRIIKRS